MYKVTIQTLTGSEHTIYYPASKDYILTSAKLSLQVGSAGEFNFTVPYNNPYYSEIVRNSIVTVYEDGDELWRGDIREIKTTFDKSLEVYALEDLAWLGDELVSMTSITNQSYAQRLTNAISTYNSPRATKLRFTAGTITSVDSSELCSWKPEWDMTLLDCLRTFIAQEGKLRVRRVTNGTIVTRYIDAVDLEDYGTQATQEIHFGYNLMEFVKNMDMTNFVNVLNPWGAETETALYDDVMQRLHGTQISNSSSINTYGRRARNVIFETDNLATLNRLAQAYLTRYSQPRITMTINAIDLGNMTNVERFHLGDLVTIIAEPFSINQQIYITKQDLDLLKIENNVLELGDNVDNNISLTSQVQTIIADITEQQTASSILNEAKANALKILDGTNGGYVSFVTNSSDQITELRIANNINFSKATKAWRWNLNGLAYLHRTNYNQSWTVGIAATMDGAISADYITTGGMSAQRITTDTMSADRIRTGQISSVDNTTYWDLDTHEFVTYETNYNKQRKTIFTNGNIETYYDGTLISEITPGEVSNSSGSTVYGSGMGIDAKTGTLNLHAKYINLGNYNSLCNTDRVSINTHDYVTLSGSNAGCSMDDDFYIHSGSGSNSQNYTMTGPNLTISRVENGSSSQGIGYSGTKIVGNTTMKFINGIYVG